MNLDTIYNNVSNAKSLLIIDHPFFGSAVSKRDIEFTDSIPTAAMTARGQMKLNPEWISGMSTKQLMFLLAHEAMHFMLMHSLRRGERDAEAWNIACDKVINDTLIEARVGTFIDGGVTEDGARDSAAEELYDENDAGSDVGGIGNDVGEPDDDMDDATREQLQAEAMIDTLQAAKVAKSLGKMPECIERLVNKLINVKTPWYQVLEQYMQGKMRHDMSWARPNRRFIGTNTYLPSAENIPRMGEIVVAIDTSGSITQDDLNHFAGHINRILTTCRPEKLHVVYCDAAIQNVEQFEPDDLPINLSLHGGGGTSFKPVFDWVSEQDFEPDVLVYLTDGYGDQNAIEPPITDVIWLTTANTNFKYGQVIEYTCEEAA